MTLTPYAPTQNATDMRFLLFLASFSLFVRDGILINNKFALPSFLSFSSHSPNDFFFCTFPLRDSSRLSHRSNSDAETRPRSVDKFSLRKIKERCKRRSPFAAKAALSLARQGELAHDETRLRSPVTLTKIEARASPAFAAPPPSVSPHSLSSSVFRRPSAVDPIEESVTYSRSPPLREPRLPATPTNKHFLWRGSVPPPNSPL